MAGEKTIQIISRLTGKVNVTVKGEPTTIFFKEARGGVGVAMVDHDEAEVLLKPALKDDFWKEGVEVQTDKPQDPQKPNDGQGGGEDGKGEDGKGGEGKQTSGGQPRAADQIAKIKVAATEEEVNAILGDDQRPSVVSAAQVRIEELKDAAEKKD